MDKGWMSRDRRSNEYENGVEEFLKFSITHSSDSNTVRCPCVRCGNVGKTTVNEIRDHLYLYGIDQSYTEWIWHGEKLGNESRTQTNKYTSDNVEDHVIDMLHSVEERFVDHPDEFTKLLEDAEKFLYPGCKTYTKLSALIMLYNLKAANGWSDKSFENLLKIVKSLLPKDNEMPVSFYEAKKTLCTLGLEYEKIHACPKDCILYRGEFKNSTQCPICRTSRWKKEKNNDQLKMGVPAHVMWYIPIIPRFKRLFQSANHAKNLTWHATERVLDGMMRHPADSPQWKTFDEKYPEFSKEPRNLRLGLCADGINPHKTLSSNHSSWPVLLTIYNLPPWLCMKRKFMMLTLMISGPKQPGNNIDVYLRPLIDDLKILWKDGIDTKDVYQDETFKMRAMLLWTINDFPAYGNLSGSTVKGYYACPVCGLNTTAQYLKHGKKICYLGHRRFLKRSHPYRRFKKAFNGNPEHEVAPHPLDGIETLKVLDKMVADLETKEKRNGAEYACWKKKSIFFELEYWKDLLVRHILDVMHIEKNICDSLIGTLLNVPGKTKDGIKSRLDLQEMGLRADLAPQEGEKRTYLPPACYTLSKEEKRQFCASLSDVKVPEGYSSNISSLVSMKDLKLVGLKSHDCHVLMQQLLPVALRGILPEKVREAITRLCLFFNSLCTKVVDPSKLDELQDNITTTICQLEMFFPPSFFDVMVHLTIHLVRELKLCGPVHLRWMYPFERYMKILKSYVRSHSRPKGCIVESYIAEEAVEFCSEYFSEAKTIGLPKKKFDSKKSKDGASRIGVFTVDDDLLEQAHLYVLRNTAEVDSYIEEHMDFLRKQHRSKRANEKWLQDLHNRTFSEWFKDQIEKRMCEPNHCISETLSMLADKPLHEVLKYHSYVLNGCRYHTKERDAIRSVQNSGVCLVASTMMVSSAKDKNPIIADMVFYGVIQEIWELDYVTFQVPVFKCDWVENNKGIIKGDLGATLVDLNRIGHKSDSFVLASQVDQVFYVTDPSDKKWSIALSTKKRGFEVSSLVDETNDTLVDIPAFTKELPSLDAVEVEEEDSFLDHAQSEHTEGYWINNNEI